MRLPCKFPRLDFVFPSYLPMRWKEFEQNYTTTSLTNCCLFSIIFPTKRSYVGQVDYDASPEELKAHFSPCGTVNRVTIICDKFTMKPKGFAYVEFVDKSSIVNALRLDGTTFKGRRIKVLPKRQNVPAARGLRGRIRSASRGRSSYGTSFRISGRGRFGRKGR